MVVVWLVVEVGSCLAGGGGECLFDWWWLASGGGWWSWWLVVLERKGSRGNVGNSLKQFG